MYVPCEDVIGLIQVMATVVLSNKGRVKLQSNLPYILYFLHNHT
jgi:hypothetical protein